MAEDIGNWKTQIRKGYLELCILVLIKRLNRVYGFDLLERLSACDLEVKEGTVYPLLNRMTTDRILKSAWVTENIKGHPRKFYSLTDHGEKALNEMKIEFSRMVGIFEELKNLKKPPKES